LARRDLNDRLGSGQTKKKETTAEVKTSAPTNDPKADAKFKRVSIIEESDEEEEGQKENSNPEVESVKGKKAEEPLKA
jgi:hypothetical protein